MCMPVYPHSTDQNSSHGPPPNCKGAGESGSGPRKLRPHMVLLSTHLVPQAEELERAEQ